MNKVVLSCVVLLASAAMAVAQKPSGATPVATSAQGYLASLFQLYHDRRQEVDSSRFADPSLAELMRTEEALATAVGDKPIDADLDLVCDCQEMESIRNARVEVSPGADGRVNATARFELYRPGETADYGARVMHYTLAQSGGQWRIYDSVQVGAKGGSVRSQLQASIRFYQKASAVKGGGGALDEAAARAVVSSALGFYAKRGEGLSEQSSQYALLVHSSFRKLLAQDALVRLPGGDIPYVSHRDVFCDCEVYEGIWDLGLGARVFHDGPEGVRDLAFVIAAFDLAAPGKAGFNEKRWMKFELRPEEGRWKIYDVENLLQDDASARRWIREDLGRNTVRVGPVKK